MKKYIAPELEVELYTLGTSLAAGCNTMSEYVLEANDVDGGTLKGEVAGIFSTDGTSYFGAGESASLYGNLVYGSPEQSGGCDCKYTAPNTRNVAGFLS